MWGLTDDQTFDGTFEKLHDSVENTAYKKIGTAISKHVFTEYVQVFEIYQLLRKVQF